MCSPEGVCGPVANDLRSALRALKREPTPSERNQTLYRILHRVHGRYSRLPKRYRWKEENVLGFIEHYLAQGWTHT